MSKHFNNGGFHANCHSKQQGLSLVELMIAITLGLLLLAGITQIFLTNKTTFNMTDSISRMEENGRYAMEMLADHVRMAGYADPTEEDIPPPFFGKCGATDAYCISNSLGCNTDDAFCTKNGDNSDSDRLAVYYDPVVNSAGGTGVDCVGTAHDGVLVNVFWVQNDATNDNLPTLYCRGYDPATPAWIGAAAQPVAPGVENFQVLFGVFNDGSTTMTPERYVNASQVTDWVNVKTVKIGLLMRSNGSGGAQQKERKYSILDVGVDGSAFTDKNPRMLYTTTIAINNVTTTAKN